MNVKDQYRAHLQRKYQIQEHHMLLAVTVSFGEPNVLIAADVAVVIETPLF